MFTGIIETVGQVVAVERTGGVAVVRVACAGLDLSDIAIGDSIAVNGVCLTVTELQDNSMKFDVSAETLNVSAGFAVDDAVNLEKSLRLDQRLGGHLVSGHVDAVGELVGVIERDGNRVMSFRFPEMLARYFARKGSVTINGVSLTVNSVGGQEFSVNLIPHTLLATNLGSLVIDSRVNLEIDVVARYVERMLSDKGGAA